MPEPQRFEAVGHAKQVAEGAAIEARRKWDAYDGLTPVDFGCPHWFTADETIEGVRNGHSPRPSERVMTPGAPATT
jgi:hypothetical protein